MANIPLFIDLPITEMLERINQLIIQINSLFYNGIYGTATQFAATTVSGLQPGVVNGSVAYVGDGLKIGEITYATGVPVYYSDGMWRTFSTDAPVVAGVPSGIVVTGSMFTGYTVAGLPGAPQAGAVAYATNGLKVGESTGTGTGIPVYYSNGAWRTFSDDRPVPV